MLSTMLHAEHTRRSAALNLSEAPNAETVEIAWSLTPRALRSPEGKRSMRSKVERSAAFRALTPGLRETLRTLLGIADVPWSGRECMVHGFAKVEAIAERRGCSTRQAMRDLARLERLGWIAKARREPVRFNLGLVFTVFDAPLEHVVAIVPRADRSDRACRLDRHRSGPARLSVRLVGVPKGPNARSGLLADLAGREPQDVTRMSPPQDMTRMSPPNREGQWRTQPSTLAPGSATAERGGVGGVRRKGHPEPADPPTAGPAEPVRAWLCGLRHAGRGPSVGLESLARLAETHGATVERLEATWRDCVSSGLSDPLAGFVARLKRGEIAETPVRAAPMPWNGPRLDELERDAVPIEEATSQAKAIRETLTRMIRMERDERRRTG